MPTFTRQGQYSLHPPQPTVGTGGYVAAGANPTPVPPADAWRNLRTATDPIVTGGVGGPRSVSFTQQRPGSAGRMTLSALMAQKKDAAARQQEAIGTPQATIPGGLGAMLSSFMEGIKGARAEQEEATGREEITQAMLGIPESGIVSPEGLATVMRRDPDLGLALYQEAMKAGATAAETSAEQWSPIPTPEGENGQWFQNQKGDTKKVGGGSPGESGWKPSDLGTLRDDYTKAAATYDNAAPTWETIKDASTRAMGQTGEGAGAADYNMVVGLAKLLDPTSVVREGEVESVKATGGAADYLVGYMNWIRGKGSLTDEMRKGILKEGSSRMQSYYDQAKQKRDWIAGIATRNKLNPDDIVPPLPDFQPWEEEKTEQATPDAAAADAPAPPKVDSDAPANGLKEGQEATDDEGNDWVIKDGKWTPKPKV